MTTCVWFSLKFSKVKDYAEFILSVTASIVSFYIESDRSAIFTNSWTYFPCVSLMCFGTSTSVTDFCFLKFNVDLRETTLYFDSPRSGIGNISVFMDEFCGEWIGVTLGADYFPSFMITSSACLS